MLFIEVFEINMFKPICRINVLSQTHQKVFKCLILIGVMCKGIRNRGIPCHKVKRYYERVLLLNSYVAFMWFC